MWQKFVHRYDVTVVYEARLSGGVYEFRRPGEETILATAPQEQFETVYRPATAQDLEEANQ